MNVKFPRGLIIDLDNIPENFETKIQKAFAEYTEGTNPAYMYQDKLAFIDRMCQLAKGDIEDEAIVEDWIDGYCKHERQEYGNFVTESDVYCQETMCEMVRLGREQAELYGEYRQHGSREDEKIMKLIVRAIKVVMNFGEKPLATTVFNCAQHGNNNIQIVDSLTINTNNKEK